VTSSTEAELKYARKNVSNTVSMFTVTQMVNDTKWLYTQSPFCNNFFTKIKTQNRVTVITERY